MPPRSPLPPRHGLQAAWVRTPDRGADAPWVTMRDFLVARLGPLGAAGVDRQLPAGGFVDQSGTPWRGDEAYRPNTFVWFHRELRAEPEVPFEVGIVHREERFVIADKPHFLSTIPRGRHVMQSLVVRLRIALGLAELGPAHRLDRLTAGLVLLTTERRWRAAYQSLFERREVGKSYRAIAAYDPDLGLPRRLGGHIVKRRGRMQSELIPGAPDNAETWLELIDRHDEWAHYRLIPATGRTHQLRVQLNALGLPIAGDPLYPVERDVSVDDFTTPLRLLADTLEFTDPITGEVRRFCSRQSLALPDGRVVHTGHHAAPGSPAVPLPTHPAEHGHHDSTRGRDRL